MAEFSYLNPRVVPVQEVTRKTFQDGEADFVLLVALIDDTPVTLSIGEQVVAEETHEAARGYLDNYSRPDGPLQDDPFQATGLRGVYAQGQTLWEEIHYRDVRTLQA